MAEIVNNPVNLHTPHMAAIRVLLADRGGRMGCPRKGVRCVRLVGHKNFSTHVLSGAASGAWWLPHQRQRERIVFVLHELRCEGQESQEAL